jgi:hypothetical protein
MVRTNARVACFLGLLTLSAASYGQSAPGEAKQQRSEAPKHRRLETVTWNPVTEELTWVVSSGDGKSGGGYVPATMENYTIHMDAALMKFRGEDRRFSEDEAARVHILMDVISSYAVESTIWWEHGGVTDSDKEARPAPGRKRKEGREDFGKPISYPEPSGTTGSSLLASAFRCRLRPER